MFEKLGVIGKKKKKIKENKVGNPNSLEITKSEIISCSRRTDIPAFLMNWVKECMKQGFVDVKNPYSFQSS